MSFRLFPDPQRYAGISQILKNKFQVAYTNHLLKAWTQELTLHKMN
jgi:hypothetical protein